MASYALLNAFAGFQFDMVHKSIGFNPVRTKEGHFPVRTKEGHFRCFWSLDSGWGEFVMTPAGCEVRVLAGTLELQAVKLPFLAGKVVSAINMDGTALYFTVSDADIHFNQPVRVDAGQALHVVG